MQECFFCQLGISVGLYIDTLRLARFLWLLAKWHTGDWTCQDL